MCFLLSSSSFIREKALASQLKNTQADFSACKQVAESQFNELECLKSDLAKAHEGLHTCQHQLAKTQSQLQQSCEKADGLQKDLAAAQENLAAEELRAAKLQRSGEELLASKQREVSQLKSELEKSMQAGELASKATAESTENLENLLQASKEATQLAQNRYSSTL